MKNRIYIKDLAEHVEQTVTIAGWVDVRRDHGKLIFLDIRDTTGKIQTVILPNHADIHQEAERLRPEWVVAITGLVHKRPEKMVNTEVANGDIELEATSITVLSAAHELPFDRDQEINLDTDLDYRPLTLRSERKQAIFTVQAEIVRAFREFFHDENFVEVQMPKLVGEDAEGGAASFAVTYFNHEAHLAQSPQFYKQIMVGVYERVFGIGNVYRAEKHSTSRHLNEYTSLDMEMGFIEDHHDVMTVTDKLMRSILEHLKTTCEKEFALLQGEFPLIPDENEIPHIKLREAQMIIEHTHGEKCSDEPDLEPQHERWISEYAKEKFNSDFLFVTHFPVEKRPMYTYEDQNDPGYTKGFDLLFRGLEIATGGQRIHDYDKLVQSMKNKKLDPDKFSFYLQAFKYGMPPHGGFGMGLERLTARYLNLANVKEAALFPRDINRIDTLLSK